MGAQHCFINGTAGPRDTPFTAPPETCLSAPHLRTKLQSDVTPTPGGAGLMRPGLGWAQVPLNHDPPCFPRHLLEIPPLAPTGTNFQPWPLKWRFLMETLSPLLRASPVGTTVIIPRPNSIYLSWSIMCPRQALSSSAGTQATLMHSG